MLNQGIFKLFFVVLLPQQKKIEIIGVFKNLLGPDFIHELRERARKANKIKESFCFSACSA